MSRSLNEQIEVKKMQLNALIEQKANYEDIYALSKELDDLINQYLDEKDKVNE